jgi:hypothetical protein
MRIEKALALIAAALSLSTLPLVSGAATAPSDLSLVQGVITAAAHSRTPHLATSADIAAVLYPASDYATFQHPAIAGGEVVLYDLTSFASSCIAMPASIGGTAQPTPCTYSNTLTIAQAHLAATKSAVSRASQLIADAAAASAVHVLTADDLVTAASRLTSGPSVRIVVNLPAGAHPRGLVRLAVSSGVAYQNYPVCFTATGTSTLPVSHAC